MFLDWLKSGPVLNLTQLILRSVKKAFFLTVLLLALVVSRCVRSKKQVLSPVECSFVEGVNILHGSILTISTWPAGCHPGGYSQRGRSSLPVRLWPDYYLIKYLFPGLPEDVSEPGPGIC